MTRTTIPTMLVTLVVLLAAPARAEVVLVEAESFKELGGWKVDQQAILEMGSTYLLAHGLGRPVADASTTVRLPKAGTWRVFVRTVDWVAKFQAAPPPGTFQVLVGGKALQTTFGTNGAAWAWQAGGEVTIDSVDKPVTLTLHDLTGFEGRCDAILLTDEAGFVPPNEAKALAAFRKKALGLTGKVAEAGEFDLVVVGGGVAGVCSAVSAARAGCTVALIQDRPVLGGNNSSEVRVWLSGRAQLGPYPRIGHILAEMNTRQKVCPELDGSIYRDDLKLKIVRAEKNISLFLNHFAFQAETSGKRITAVVARNIRTSQEVRFQGRMFVDSTGDGTIGAAAGADWDMTQEGHMGRTNLWYPRDTGKPQPFPRCPWAIDLSDKPFPTRLNRLGKWFWESGFYRNPIKEGERIRDNNFRAMYGAWDALKNVKGLYPNHEIAWAAYIAGKRESRRLLGDVVLTKEHVLGGKEFPDALIPCTWKIDLHLPDKRYDKGFENGDEWLSRAHFTGFRTPYLLPYRCLYSRNIENLFMAGRNISVTHEALGTVRVMRTTGMMGEVVGAAAALAKKHNTTPRGVYEKYLDELKDTLGGPIESGAVAAGRTKELEAFLAKVGENLAPKATLQTSPSHERSAKATVLTDGKADLADNDGRWLSEEKVPNFVEFTWDKPVTIAAARIVSGYFANGRVTAPISDFRLEYEVDGAWKLLPGTETIDNPHANWLARFEPVQAKKVRLVVTKVSIDVSRIWEIALYAPKPK